MSQSMPHLVVFSHLRWGFVYQRPQHLLARLAEHYQVLFVEEPEFAEAPSRLDCALVAPNVEVITPRTPVERAGFNDDQLTAMRPLLEAHLESRGITDYMVWFYTPMALPLLAGMSPRAVIYDCMDEITAHSDAAAEAGEREASLLKIADLVLTSGPALYEAKREVHPNVQCLPSGVEASHYSPSNLQHGSDEHRDAERLQRGITGPRLGFFGVVDERVDLALLAALADADPNWQIVMVGPVMKIDPADLPRRPNIHWLGMQPYSRLPQLVAGWDVCLMPFAMNDLTKFISPTKTLEYMAAEKPVVSTSVPDVVSLYGDVVRLAGTRAGFIEQCREALGESGRRRAQRVMEMTQCVARFSWTQSAKTVQELIEQQLCKTGPAAPEVRVEAPLKAMAPTVMDDTRAIVANAVKHLAALSRRHDALNRTPLVLAADRLAPAIKRAA